jgi:hypothetical protein
MSGQSKLPKGSLSESPLPFGTFRLAGHLFPVGQPIGPMQSGKKGENTDDHLNLLF